MSFTCWSGDACDWFGCRMCIECISILRLVAGVVPVEMNGMLSREQVDLP